MRRTRLFILTSSMLAVLTAAIGALSPSSAPTTAAAAPALATGLHVSGNKILNGAGQQLLLHGVNRSSAEYACSDGDGIWDGPADAAEVQAMLTWNINLVRVVLNEDCWLGINGVMPAYAGANYQNAIAAYVNLLTQANIVTIINLHFNAPGTKLATGQQPMPDRDHSPAFWTSVANRFKGNSAVLFEPYNEPYPDAGNNSTAAWTCWRDGGTCSKVSFTAAGMQELVTAIRNTGAANPIILTGNNWGSQLDQWVLFRPNDPLNQLIAGWHSYGDGLDCQNLTCWNSVLATVLQSAPIIATEIGEFDCGHSYIDQVMNWLDSHNQGYTAWSWGAYNCAQDPALLTDWSGTPTQTYGSGFRSHLLSVPNFVGAANATNTPTSVPGATQTPVPTVTSAGQPTATRTSTATPSATATTAPNPPSATATRTSLTGGTKVPTVTPTSDTQSRGGLGSYRAVVLGDAPTSYWRLDESNGTMAADQASGHPGTYVNAPVLGQPGATSDSDSSATFVRRSRDSMRVPYSAALNPTTFTAEVWAYPTGSSGTYRAAMGSRDYPKGWVIYAGTDNTWEFWVNSGSGMATVSSGSIQLNTWTHLVGTFDGSTARFYVNGSLAGSTSVTRYQPQTSNPLLVGLPEPGTSFWFDGRLDEAAVYPTALSAAQVSHHYESR